MEVRLCSCVPVQTSGDVLTDAGAAYVAGFRGLDQLKVLCLCRRSMPSLCSYGRDTYDELATSTTWIGLKMLKTRCKHTTACADDPRV